MSFAPYLVFPGTARDAMTFYAQVFGATDLQIMGFDDTPPDQRPPEQRAPTSAPPAARAMSCLPSSPQAPARRFPARIR